MNVKKWGDIIAPILIFISLKELLAKNYSAKSACLICLEKMKSVKKKKAEKKEQCTN